MNRRAITVSARWVVQATRGKVRGRERDFGGVATDSRRVQPQDLFVALSGPRFDGHDYVFDAEARGASGFLVEEGRGVAAEGTVIEVPDVLSAFGGLGSAWRQQCATTVIGLTGSNGKTSTKELLAALIGREHEVLATAGNFNNLIGVPLTLLELRPEHPVAVIEMGMNKPGEIRRLTELVRPQVGLLLNVGPAHIGELGSMEAIAAAKGELFEALPEDAVAVANRDDHRVMEQLALHGRTCVRTFGEHAGADVQLLTRRVDEGRQALSIGVDGQAVEVPLAWPGRHSALNATAAIAAATALPDDLRPSFDAIREALRDLPPVAGRFVVRRLNGRVVVDDTYNANPASLTEGLVSVRESAPTARLGVVLGAMGELGSHSEALHREAGAAIAGAGPDFFATYGPDARPAFEAAVAEGVAAEHYDDDLDGLWDFVASRLAPGTWLYLKGSRQAGLERLLARLENV